MTSADSNPPRPAIREAALLSPATIGAAPAPRRNYVRPTGESRSRALCRGFADHAGLPLHPFLDCVLNGPRNGGDSKPSVKRTRQDRLRTCPQSHIRDLLNPCDYIRVRNRSVCGVLYVGDKILSECPFAGAQRSVSCAQQNVEATEQSIAVNVETRTQMLGAEVVLERCNANIHNKTHNNVKQCASRQRRGFR